MGFNVIKTRAKRIFTPTKIPGADFVLNPYVGCSFACSYCYARFMCRFKPYGAWGSWVEAKINAPELVKKEKVKGKVVMSSVSDAYQPVEAELELTKRVLENMDKGTELEILTKSPLILRDIELLKEFKKLEVGFTLSFEGRAKKLFEPKTPSVKSRIKALKKLKEEGIKTYGFISPVVPGVTDVEALVERSRDHVDYFWIELVNLRASGPEFKSALRENYPEAFEIASSFSRMEEFARGLLELDVPLKGVVLHPWRVFQKSFKL